MCVSGVCLRMCACVYLHVCVDVCVCVCVCVCNGGGGGGHHAYQGTRGELPHHLPLRYSLMTAGESLSGSTVMNKGCTVGRPGVLSGGETNITHCEIYHRLWLISVCAY